MNVRVNLVSLKRFKIQMDTGTPARGWSGDEKAGGKKMTVKSKFKELLRILGLLLKDGFSVKAISWDCTWCISTFSGLRFRRLEDDSEIGLKNKMEC